MRRWLRAARIEGTIWWLKMRRGMLADEWRRCMTVAEDVRFGMHLTRARSE